MSKMNIKHFVLIFITICSFSFLMISFMNPLGQNTMPWSLYDTGIQKKEENALRSVGNSKVKVLLFGSSRSKHFKERSMIKKFMLDSKIINVTQMGLELKSILISKAIRSNSIKRIISVTDYSEFYDFFPSEKLIYNERFSPLVSDSLLERRFNWSYHFLSFFNPYSLYLSFKRAFNPNTRLGSHKVNSELFATFFLPQDPVTVLNQLIKRRYTKLNHTFSLNLDHKYKLNAQAIFIKLLKRLHKRKINFNLVISPLHPVIYNKMVINHPQYYKKYSEWINWLKHVEKKYPLLSVHDFSRSEKFIGNGPEFWIDGIHYTQKSSDIFLDNI